MDVGDVLTAVLTDGRTVEGKLTFGDIARAELQTQSNFMQRFSNTDSFTVADLAVLCYQVGVRTGAFTEPFEQFLMVLDHFVVPEDEEDTNSNGAVKEGDVHPFPMAAQE